MAAFVPLPTRVGEIQTLDGFFTQAFWLRGRSSAEVEQNLGYRAGRLREGWWLMFLKQMPGERAYEFRGYSQMSGGIPQGHLPGNSGQTSEDRLKAGGYNLYGTSYQREGMKARIIRTLFTLSGSNRLAKVRPVARAHGEDGVPDYPPGSGIPQWTLVEPLPWVAAAFIAPGDKYMGMYEDPAAGR